MGLFHRHTYTTFTCHANEIDGFRILSAKDAHTGAIIAADISDVRCPDHRKQYIRQREDDCCICAAYGCDFKAYFLKPPPLKEILITYKKCSCSHYLIDVQCGKNKYVVNKEYIMQKIELLKKKKEDAEIDRLLNLGNPDYNQPKETDGVDHEKLVEEYVMVIDKLQNDIRKMTAALNHSLQNDGIWEALPDSVRENLIKKFGKKARQYAPLDPEDIIKQSTMKENKNVT